ncbi:hypothetical protein ACQ4LE_010446 [Meloidogyne hapla]
MRQNSSAPSGIQNSVELGLFKSQQIIQPPRRTKRIQNFQNVGGSLSLSFDTSALEDLLEVGKNEMEEERRRKTINAIGLGRNVADMIATNRSGIEFFAPEYSKDHGKQQIKNQLEDKKNLFQSNGIKNIEESGLVIEKIKKCQEKFRESKDFDKEDDEEFWNGISALKTTKYGITTVRSLIFQLLKWCIAWNGAAMYLVSDRLGEFLLNLLLGILGFWQAKRISKKQNFRKLLNLLAPTLIFIQTALMVLQRSALEAFASFKITLPIATNYQMKKQQFDFQFDGQLASVFAIGNTVLMCFVCYCNLSVLRFILQKVGARLDEIYIENFEMMPKK